MYIYVGDLHETIKNVIEFKKNYIWRLSILENLGFVHTLNEKRLAAIPG